MAKRDSFLIINNKSPYMLVESYATLSHGVWSDDNNPLNEVKPNEVTRFHSESSGIFTGTQGSVQYKAFNNQFQQIGVLDFDYDNPYAGTNEFQKSSTTSFITISCTVQDTTATQSIACDLLGAAAAHTETEL